MTIVANFCLLQYFVFDFHIPPDVMFDKILKVSVSILLQSILTDYFEQQLGQNCSLISSFICLLNLHLGYPLQKSSA